MTEAAEHLRTREQQILWIAGQPGGLKPGSFYQHLINAFFAADRFNLIRLKRAFPVVGEAYETYMRGELTKGK